VTVDAEAGYRMQPAELVLPARRRRPGCTSKTPMPARSLRDTTASRMAQGGREAAS